MNIVLIIIAAATLAAARLGAQNIPDRILVFDPLADRAADTAGFTPLNATSLAAEFARYSNGSGAHHRWNARTGGFVEFARWDSTWSIAFVGMMEMVADPFSDIGFNPRAIFWQEGLVASARVGHDETFQFGYVHRCKHDIDNLEPLLIAGRYEQETLIYSGVMTQLAARPRAVTTVPMVIMLGGALRNDFFVHLFDDRVPAEADGSGRSMTTLADAINLTARIDARPSPNAHLGAHLSADWMLSLFGHDAGFAGRWHGLRALGSMPFIELGLDFLTPRAATFTLFARGEWQRDGAIVPFAAPATLFLFGIRTTGSGVAW